MALDDPAQFAGVRRAQDVRRSGRSLVEQAFDGPHRLDQPLLLGVGQARQQTADLLLRAAIERFEDLTAVGGEAERRLSTIVW